MGFGRRGFSSNAIEIRVMSFEASEPVAKNNYPIDQKGNILIISKIDPFTIGVHITNFHDSQLVEILVYIIAVLKNYLLLLKITYESGIREA